MLNLIYFFKLNNIHLSLCIMTLLTRLLVPSFLDGRFLKDRLAKKMIAKALL